MGRGHKDLTFGFFATIAKNSAALRKFSYFPSFLFSHILFRYESNILGTMQFQSQRSGGTVNDQNSSGILMLAHFIAM